MDGLKIFENEEFGQVRTVTIDGEPWFVGKDVARALGYGEGKSLNNAVANHVDEEDKGVTDLMTPGGKQNFIIINESGLYALIFGSKQERAKRFKRWVTSEVLPALRKTGHYEMLQYKQQASQRALTKDDYIRAASIVSGCRNERLPYVMAFLEQAGLDMPEVEQIKRQAEVVAKSGLDTEEKLHEYAMLLMEDGIPKNGWLIVPSGDFNDFCAMRSISAFQFRK